MTKNLKATFTLPHGAEHPEIYVICKATYQSGNIHGVWVDITKPMQDILKRIALMKHESGHLGSEMLSEGYCPDPGTYLIHCHIGFYNLKIDVNASIEDVRAYGLFISQYGELGAKLIVINNGNLEKAKRFIDEYYLGEYESRTAYAKEFFKQPYLSQIPKALSCHVNCDCVEETILQSFFVKISDKVHVFEYLELNNSGGAGECTLKSHGI